MVVAAHPLASEAGAKILKDGGSAVDAVIATLLGTQTRGLAGSLVCVCVSYVRGVRRWCMCIRPQLCLQNNSEMVIISNISVCVTPHAALNVVEPQSSGIGGGGFALLHELVVNSDLERETGMGTDREEQQGHAEVQGGEPDSDSHTHAHTHTHSLTSWDGRETAPHKADPYMFMQTHTHTHTQDPLPFMEAVETGMSVGVPGIVRLMETLWKKSGGNINSQSVQWKDLFGPAIKLARDGFPVSPRLSALLQNDVHKERLTKHDSTARVFYPNGTALKEGEILRQNELAETLQEIAEGGGGCILFPHREDSECHH